MGVSRSIGHHHPEDLPPLPGVRPGASAASVSGAALMERYASGDESAFSQLYARYAPTVYQLFLALTHDRHESDDLTQTTFLKVHRARASFTPSAALVPWLMTIARRCFYDNRRTRLAHRELLCPGASLDWHAAGEVPDPYDMWRLDRALARLPSFSQEAVLLTTFLGYSLKEAAATLGSTPGAIKVRAHRGRHQLRNLLEQPS